jgi:hypothetical protein
MKPFSYNQIKISDIVEQIIVPIKAIFRMQIFFTITHIYGILQAI